MVDELIVAVVTDEPVKKQKGDDRPLFPYEHRFAIIDALKWPTYVVKSESFDPTETYRKAEAAYGKIDLFLRTEDQTHIDTSKVEAEVVILPRTPNVSSTELIKRVRSLQGRSPE